MRFVSFQYENKQSWGALDGENVIDLSHLSPSLMSALLDLPSSMAEIKNKSVIFPLGDLKLQAPIPNPEKILCVGQNYVAHRDEMGGNLTAKPLIFTRYPASILGHNAELIKPEESEQYDFEGELALIIGKPGRRISSNDALSHIAGYSCFMDGSIRDYQNHTTQYIPGKNFDGSGSFGPWMISADELADPNAGLSLQTRLNGKVMQQTTTDLMIFDIPTIIAYVSTFTTLEPGDVIATGTPGGVGYKRDPQVFMKPGDRIEVEVEAVATLSNLIA